MTNECPAEIMDLAQQLETELMKQYGPMLTGNALVASLGYPSRDAFRQACARGTVPVHVFPIERRRGRYALAKDVARWIAKQRFQQTQPQKRYEAEKEGR